MSKVKKGEGANSAKFLSCRSLHAALEPCFWIWYFGVKFGFWGRAWRCITEFVVLEFYGGIL
ncbi:MAG: hypothetical protein SPI60_01285 [Campylobacter lanienae]|nr:hypothetical protein [Campylobacter lanienae]MDY6056422.1 hypothetical protein [Campylobacter lanienae]